MKLACALTASFIIASNGISASAATEGKTDPAEILISHVADGHKWKIIPFVNEVSLRNISLGRFNIPVTRNVVMLLIITVILMAIFIPAFNRSYVVPHGISAILEPVLLFVKDSIVIPSMGQSEGRKWLSFFYTLFFFLLISNLLGLIPLFTKVTANLSVAAALASMIFVLLVGSGMKRNGIVGFFKEMIPSGIPLPFGIFILIIEIPGLIIRCCVLAIRLFANMIAGHFVGASLLLLIFILNPFAAILSVPMTVFVDLLEILVAIIQAIVFTMLSAIFIGSAINHH